MQIAIAGGTGFIGTKIRNSFVNERIIHLSRQDLYGNEKDLADKIRGVEIVMNFTGHPIVKRWTRKTKEKIFSSRIDVTHNIILAINSLEEKPFMLINASAIGIYEYGSIATEKEFIYGKNFLSNVVKKWEDEADKVSKEVKLIKLRFGLILGNDGGVFPRMKNLFRLGFGGVIGNGKQVYSFIHIDDLTDALRFLIEKKASGVYNFTAPEPVTNKKFSGILANKMGKTAILKIPSFFLYLILGEASCIATRGQTVYPQKLLDEGYNFTFDTIEKVFDKLLDIS